MSLSFSSEHLYFEAVQSALRIEEPAEMSNALLKIVDSLHVAGNDEYARALFPKALDQIHKLSDPKEKAYLLRLSIRLACKMQLPAEAVAMLSFLEGGAEDYDAALREVALSWVQADDLDRALNMAEDIEDYDDYEAVLEAVGKRQAIRGFFAKSLQTAANIDIGESRCRLLCRIGLELWEAGQPEEALETLRQAVVSARDIDEPDVRDRSILKVIKGFIKIYRVFDALPLAREIIEPAKQVEALCLIFVFFRQNGNASGGQATLTEAGALAKTISDPACRAASLCRIGTALHHLGETDKARDVFREAFSAVKSIHNPYSQTRSMTELGIRMGELGTKEVAKRLFRQAVDQALTIESFTFQSLCLCRIVDAQANASLRDEAADTLARIEELREEIPRREALDGTFDRDRAIGIGCLAVAILHEPNAERPEDGKAFFRQAIASAHQIGNIVHRTSALQSLAEKLASIEKLENVPDKSP